MGAKAFDVYGQIDLKGGEKVDKDLRRAEDSAKRAATGLDKTQKSSLGVGAAFKLIGAAAIAKGFWDSAQAAGDLAEQTSKISVVFGQASSVVYDFAKTSSEALGISERAALTAAGTFGNLFRSLKMGEQESADMSVQLVKLAADLASFNNANPEDVLLALRSGLVGETEPLRQFGINLNDARLQEKALSLGLTKTTKEVLPASAKAQAAYALILDDTALAQGDFSRTSEGLANQQRIVAARFDDAKVSLGQNLTPALLDATEAANGLLEAFNDMDPETRKTAISTTLMGAGFIGAFAGGAKLLQWGKEWVPVAGKVASGFETVRLYAMYAAEGMAGPIAATVAGFGGLIYGAGEAGEAIVRFAASDVPQLVVSQHEADAGTQRLLQTTNLYTAGVHQTTGALRENTTAFRDLHPIVATVSTDSSDAAKATQEYTAAAAASQAATDALSNAVAGYTEQLLYAKNNLTIVQTAEQRAVQDKIAVKAATEAKAEAIKKYGKNSDEAKLAQLNLIAAQNKAKDSAKVVKDASAIAAEAARTAGDKARVAADKWNALARAMAGVAAKTGNAVRVPGSQMLFAEGGRPSGPTSGYPVTLHGTEWVIPEKRDANALSLWRQAGEAIGAFANMSAPVSTSGSSAVQSGGAVYIIADSRYTDMSKLRNEVDSMNRSGISSGMLMARMGMQGA